MTKLNFTDGESFDTDGPLRIEERSDGLYVVGEGMLMACETREEAQDLIDEIQARLDRSGGAS